MGKCIVCEEEIRKGEPTVTTTLLNPKGSWNIGERRKVHSLCYVVAVLQAGAVHAKENKEREEQEKG